MDDRIDDLIEILLKCLLFLLRACFFIGCTGPMIGVIVLWIQLGITHTAFEQGISMILLYLTFDLSWIATLLGWYILGGLPGGKER